MIDTVSNLKSNCVLNRAYADDAPKQATAHINEADLASLPPEKHQDSKTRDTISLNIPFPDMHQGKWDYHFSRYE